MPYLPLYQPKPKSDFENFANNLKALYMEHKTLQGKGVSGGFNIMELLPHLLPLFMGGGSNNVPHGTTVCHHCQGSGLRLRLPQ